MRRDEMKKKSFICSRCGDKVIGKPVKIAFFIGESDTKLSDAGLPDDMKDMIQENYCGVCAVRIRYAMLPAEKDLPSIPALLPGYKPKKDKAEAKGRGKYKIRVPHEEDAKIWERHMKGESFVDIAKSYGVTGVTISNRFWNEQYKRSAYKE